MADDEMYLENLKEFVLDEERIVTYKWLSRTLSVNVNHAKQMLYAFILQQREEKADNICIIYTVGGLIKDKDGNMIQKYLFSHEKDLQDIKQCYDNITSLHVYSIQKATPKDSNVLYLADYDLQKQNMDSPNRWSNITLNSIKKRVVEIQETFAKDESKSKETEKPISNGFQQSVQNKVQVQPNFAPSNSKSKSSNNSKSKAKPTMKKGDVTSFFARQTASKIKVTVTSVNGKSGKDEEAQEKKETELNNVKEKEQNKSDHISADKNVKNEKKSIQDEKESVKAKKVKEKDTEIKEKDDDTKTNDVIENEAAQEANVDTRKSNQGDKKSRKTQKQDKNEKENQEGKEMKSKKRKSSSKKGNEESEEKTKTQRKKRKRVKNFSDTSSEEEDNSLKTKQSGSSTETTDSTPIHDQQVQNVQPETQKVRRRKRVLKSKTYLNDQGYMVTEKVYESESASSEDEQKKPEVITKVDKPAVSIQPPKKKPANKATKQASLTSFFKRT